MIPKLAFTLMEGISWAGSAGVALRSRLLTPASGAVLAVIPLFFAWRSLDNYFYLVPFLVLAIILTERRLQQTTK
jgi:hypothetical protein